MNIERIPYHLTTMSDEIRHDYNVCIGTELYYFYILEIRFKETDTIEFWIGEYTFGIMQMMFGIKFDDLGKELRHKYLYSDIELLEPYIRRYINEIIFK